MQLLTVGESKQLLGVKDVDAYGSLSKLTDGKVKSYYLPKLSADQTVLARAISSFVLGLGQCWMQITYWHNDADSNQELFYGYRKGHGDVRSLAEASIYLFAPGDEEVLSSVLCMVLYFSWDARLFNWGRSPTYLITLGNDGFVDYQSASERFMTGIEHEFSLLGLACTQDT